MFAIRTFLAFALMLFSFGSFAKTMVLHQRYEGDVQKAAKTAIDRFANDLGFAKAEIDFLNQTKLKDGYVIRFQQTIDGKPVIGADLSVTALRNQLVAISGKLKAFDQIHNERAINLDQLDALLKKINTNYKRVSAKEAFLVTNKIAKSVWVVRVLQRKPLDAFRMIIDAKTGKIMQAFSVIHSAEAKGNAYIYNPSSGNLKEVNLSGLDDKSLLKGRYVDVQSCGYTDDLNCERFATYDEVSEYSAHQPDEPSLEDAFAEVNAYYQVDTFHAYMKEHFDFSRPNGEQINMFVNFYVPDQYGNKTGMPNAFFGDIDGDNKGEIVFGQDTIDFSYDGDVIYHEFTHSIIDETSKLEPYGDDWGINGFPLALNEAFADLMSCFYTNDPKLGDYAGGVYSEEKVIRDLSGPVMTCDDLIAESHRDGQIFARTIWAIRNQVDDKETFDKIIYNVMVGLSSQSGFTDAATLLRATAKTLDPAIEKIADTELKTRNIDNCSRFLEVKKGVTKRGFIYGTRMIPVAAVPGGLQYYVDVPENAESMTITVAGEEIGWGYYTQVGAYVRWEKEVDYQNTTYDFVQDATENSITLSINDSKNNLKPGSRYYILPLNVGQYEGFYSVDVSFATNPLSTDVSAGLDMGVSSNDGSTTEEKSSDGGCSMNATPISVAWPFLLLIGLIVSRKFWASI